LWPELRQDLKGRQQFQSVQPAANFQARAQIPDRRAPPKACRKYMRHMAYGVKCIIEHKNAPLTRLTLASAPALLGARGRRLPQRQHRSVVLGSAARSAASRVTVMKTFRRGCRWSIRRGHSSTISTGEIFPSRNKALLGSCHSVACQSHRLCASGRVPRVAA
jgi:hypothetical protein